MSRKFIAGVLSISIAIAGFGAAPARASDTDDIARFLGAAATIFIIGKAIESSNQKHKKKQKKQNAHRDNHVYKPVPRVVDRHPRRWQDRAPLPRRCVRHVEGGWTKRVLMSRCLERRYRSAYALPNACRMTVDTARGYRPAYSMRCLRKRGYTLAQN